MHRTNIYLDDRQTRSLDELARAQGISRASLIRRLIDSGLDETDDDLASDLTAIETSFGVLAGEVELPERGADERARHFDALRGER